MHVRIKELPSDQLTVCYVTTLIYLLSYQKMPKVKVAWFLSNENDLYSLKTIH